MMIFVLFISYLLNTYYVADTVPQSENIVENQAGKVPHQWNSHFSKGKYAINNNNK